jgi:hypothetical protein
VPRLGRRRAAPQLTFRWFDAEAFPADPTDIAMITTTSITAWYDLYEALRDTPLWTVPYFQTRQIILAVEDGFAGYESRSGGTDPPIRCGRLTDRGAPFHERHDLSA